MFKRFSYSDPILNQNSHKSWRDASQNVKRYLAYYVQSAFKAFTQNTEQLGEGTWLLNTKETWETATTSKQQEWEAETKLWQQVVTDYFNNNPLPPWLEPKSLNQTLQKTADYPFQASYTPFILQCKQETFSQHILMGCGQINRKPNITFFNKLTEAQHAEVLWRTLSPEQKKSIAEEYNAQRQAMYQFRGIEK